MSTRLLVVVCATHSARSFSGLQISLACSGLSGLSKLFRTGILGKTHRTLRSSDSPSSAHASDEDDQLCSVTVSSASITPRSGMVSLLVWPAMAFAAIWLACTRIGGKNYRGEYDFKVPVRVDGVGQHVLVALNQREVLCEAFRWLMYQRDPCVMRYWFLLSQAFSPRPRM